MINRKVEFTLCCDGCQRSGDGPWNDTDQLYAYHQSRGWWFRDNKALCSSCIRIGAIVHEIATGERLLSVPGGTTEPDLPVAEPVDAPALWPLNEGGFHLHDLIGPQPAD